MRYLGTDPNAPSGISLILTCRGSNKRVSIRGWFPPESTTPALHLTLEELAQALGLTVPPRKKAERKTGGAR